MTKSDFIASKMVQGIKEKHGLSNEDIEHIVSCGLKHREAQGLRGLNKKFIELYTYFGINLNDCLLLVQDSLGSKEHNYPVKGLSREKINEIMFLSLCTSCIT